MSTVVGEGVVRLRADTSGVDVDKEGKKAGKEYSDGFKGSLKGLAVAVGGAIAVDKVFGFVKESVQGAADAQKVTEATEQIIKTTGSAANVTANQVGRLSDALERKTGIDGDVIKSGQNLLLTFTAVRNEAGKGNDIFNRATKAAVDLSAAGFGSVSGASVQLGKALQDPLKGISALAKSGVSFTEAQKDQIKALVESGKLLDAQKIILGGVEGQVGGVAEATASYGDRALAAFHQIQDVVGFALLPVMQKLADYFINTITPTILTLLNNVGKLKPVFDGVKSSVQGFFAAGGNGGGFIDQLKTEIPVLVNLFQTQLLPAFEKTVTAVASQVLPVVKNLANLFVTQFLPAVQVVAQQVVANFIPVLQQASVTFQTKVLPAIAGLAQYLVTNLVPVVAKIVTLFATQVVPVIAEVARFVYAELYPALVSIALVVAKNLKPVFDQLFKTFQTRILPTLQKVATQIRTQLIPVLEPLVKRILVVVGALLKFAAAVLGKVLPPLLRLYGFLFSKIIPVFVTVITKIISVINFLVKLGVGFGKAVGFVARFEVQLATLVSRGIQNVISAISSLPGKVVSFGGKLLSAGKELIGSLLRGIGDAAKGVGGLVGNIASSVGHAVADAVKGAINGVIDAFNNAIPNSISVPFGPDIDLPDNPIPRLATGSSFFRGGVATVGEVGRERVYLPRGSRVLSAGQTRSAETADMNRLLEVLGRVGGGATVNVYPQTGDPQAIAMQVLNRLSVAG